MSGKITFIYQNDNGDDVIVGLPAKHEVCWKCEGHGTHLTPSIGEHAYSAEEFCESFDEEEREEYFSRGGRYDVVCGECGGKNVVLGLDEEHIERYGTREEKEGMKVYCEQEREDVEYERECEAERRMGA